jgi:hypothetical protein
MRPCLGQNCLATGWAVVHWPWWELLNGSDNPTEPLLLLRGSSQPWCGKCPHCAECLSLASCHPGTEECFMSLSICLLTDTEAWLWKLPWLRELWGALCSKCVLISHCLCQTPPNHLHPNKNVSSFLLGWIYILPVPSRVERMWPGMMHYVPQLAPDLLMSNLQKYISQTFVTVAKYLT